MKNLLRWFRDLCSCVLIAWAILLFSGLTSFNWGTDAFTKDYRACKSALQNYAQAQAKHKAIFGALNPHLFKGAHQASDPGIAKAWRQMEERGFTLKETVEENSFEVSCVEVNKRKWSVYWHISTSEDIQTRKHE